MSIRYLVLEILWIQQKTLFSSLLFKPFFPPLSLSRMASMELQVCALLGSFLVVLGARPEIFGKPHSIITNCQGAGSATYQVDFHGEWSQRAFPRQYPIFRPNAQWSAVLGEFSLSYNLESYRCLFLWYKVKSY